MQILVCFHVQTELYPFLMVVNQMWFCVQIPLILCFSVLSLYLLTSVLACHFVYKQQKEKKAQLYNFPESYKIKCEMPNPCPPGETRGLTRNALIQNYCREPNLIQLRFSAPLSSAQHRSSSGAVTVRSHSNCTIENKVDFVFCFHSPLPFIHLFPLSFKLSPR